MKFKFIVSKDELDAGYQKALQKSKQKTHIKGFRKGQAPLNLVEKAVGEATLKERAVEEALPQAYMKALKEKKLEPITYPELKLLTKELKDDLEFEAEIALKPEVKLGKYKDAVKEVLVSKSIWTPDQDKDAKDPSREDKIEAILSKLLETVKIEVPELISRREAHRQMAKLVDQINSIGMNMDDYLKGSKLTSDQLHEKYHKAAADQVALEFILMEVANDLKIEISSQEVDSFISTVSQGKGSSRLEEPDQRAAIAVMLTKQKVIEALLTL